jgi:hypothetical protein
LPFQRYGVTQHLGYGGVPLCGKVLQSVDLHKD